MSLNGFSPLHASVASHFMAPNPAATSQCSSSFHCPAMIASTYAPETAGAIYHQGHALARMCGNNRSWIDSRRCQWLQTINNKFDVVLGAHDKRELPRLQRQLPIAVSRLLEPVEFEASKLRVEFMRGSSSTDVLDAGRCASRVYTLTHCDVTATLHLSIGKKVNHRQLRGWYQRLLRDEVIARWHMHPSGDNSLHVHCHVSGAHALMAPAVLRNWIFTREMPVVLQAIRYGDQALLRRQPELCMAPVWVHFQSDSEEFHRAELWGPLFFAASGVGLSDPRKANTCRASMIYDEAQALESEQLLKMDSSMDGAVPRDVSHASEQCRGSALAELCSANSSLAPQPEASLSTSSAEAGDSRRRKPWVNHTSHGFSALGYREVLAEVNGSGRAFECTEERSSHNSICANVGVLDVASAMDGQLLTDVGARRERRVAVGSNGYDLS